MFFQSTRDSTITATLDEAILQGLAPDGGLYVPQALPPISPEQIKSWQNLSYLDLAFELAQLWYGDEIPALELRRMVDEAYADFEPILKQVSDGVSVLELFHGPTLSFKDFGARMLAQLMNYFAKRQNKQLTILAATSGDTGVAVASAFAGLEHIRVVILYPQGKVSLFQEGQMLSLQGNVHVYAVDGSFDDCQANVKQAFLDPGLRDAQLTSANSINIGRLIPQSWYYIYAYLQTLKMRKCENSKIVFSIPSGNFGNLTACLIAKLQGLPVHQIIAATNINDIVPHFLTTGEYQIKDSQLTIANSMDIGNPSNWERIRHYLGEDHQELSKTIFGVSKSDEQIRSTIKQISETSAYILDPHGAVSFQALLDYQTNHPETKGIAVMTGSPYKYRPLLESITHQQFPSWPELAVQRGELTVIKKNYQLLKDILLS